MTLRTSSATRFSVVSRSSVVLTTSATSSSRGSTLEGTSDWTAEISTLAYDIKSLSIAFPRTLFVGCHRLRGVPGGALEPGRSHFPHDGDSGAGADAVRAGLDHGVYFGGRADPARGLHPRPLTHGRT